MTASSLADACPSPSCHPGDYPATEPAAVLSGFPGAAALYVHDECGTAWRTRWDASGRWPLERDAITRPELPALADNEIEGRHAA